MIIFWNEHINIITLLIITNFQSYFLCPYLILSNLFLFCAVLYCSVLTCPVFPCPVLSCIALSCLVLPCLVVFYLILLYHFLSCLVYKGSKQFIKQVLIVGLPVYHASSLITKITKTVLQVQNLKCPLKTSLKHSCSQDQLFFL